MINCSGIAKINYVLNTGSGNNNVLSIDSCESLLGKTFVFRFSPCTCIPNIVICLTNTQCIFINKASWAWVANAELFDALFTGSWQGISISIYGQVLAIHRQLFCYTNFLLRLFGALVTGAWWEILSSRCGRVQA